MKIAAILPAACINLEHPGIKGEIKTLLADLEGKPLLQHVVERLKTSKLIDEIIITTSDREVDKVVVDLAREWGVKAYIGKNYGEKYIYFKWVYEAAIKEKVDYIVHVGTFVPFIDANIIDKTIQFHIETNSDYTMPTGWMGFVVWSPEQQLEYYLSNIGESSFDCNSPKIFYVGNSKINFYSYLNVTTEDKVEIAQRIYNKLYPINKTFGYEELVNLYNNEPKLFNPYPLVVTLELTNDCNLSCIMCPRNKMSRKTGYMSFDLYKKVTDELPFKTEINLSMCGEPLMHPDILKMIEYGVQKGIKIYLYTNGTLLNEEMSKKLVESGLTGVIISIDAVKREVYRNIKKEDKYDEVVKNVTRFLELKKEFNRDKPKKYGEQKPVVGIQILKMRENDAEIEEFMNKWDYLDKAEKMINYKNRVQELSKIENEEKKSQASQELNNELWETFYEKFLPVEHAIIGHFNNFCGQIDDRSVIDVTPLKRFPCQQLKEDIAILWNGDVVMCLQDFDGKMVLGNLQEDLLSDVWQNQRLKDIWQAHRVNNYDNLPLCSRCKEWYYSLKA